MTNYKIVTIKINDFVKETRTNKIGIVKEINFKLDRFLLDFPINNQFGWYGLNEIKIIDNIDKELNN
mgnify:CR=1 FL=1|tara:strand:+ start:198 stop:398 length:201 start_codon:yes stop_codon:yes gene_type:complete